MTEPPANFGKNEISEAMKPRAVESAIEEILLLFDNALELAHQRIAQLEAELASAQKPLRWTSEVPKMPGNYAWLNERNEIGTIQFRPKDLTGLSGIYWFGHVRFYGPIPEPKG